MTAWLQMDPAGMTDRIANFCRNHRIKMARCNLSSIGHAHMCLSMGDISADAACGITRCAEG